MNWPVRIRARRIFIRRRESIVGLGEGVGLLHPANDTVDVECPLDARAAARRTEPGRGLGPLVFLTQQIARNGPLRPRTGRFDTRSDPRSPASLE